MGRPADARATFIAREGRAQDWPEPPTESPVKYPRVNSQSSGMLKLPWHFDVVFNAVYLGRCMSASSEDAHR